MNPALDATILALANRIDIGFSFILYLVRFTICFSLIPGLGQGASGLAVRASAILVLAAASLSSAIVPSVPPGWGDVVIMVASEVALGLLLGLLPQLIVAATHLAGSLASTAMGLGAAQLFDPSLGDQSSSLGKLYGDLAIIIFLLINGHHTVILAASGLAGTLPPGVFAPSPNLILQIAAATGIIFKLGILIASPIIATLLITQFVLGILSKTVPSVNVFFISFPITVAIGLSLAAASLPSFVVVAERGIVDITHLLIRAVVG